jgi:hypothetical protein
VEWNISEEIITSTIKIGLFALHPFLVFAQHLLGTLDFASDPFSHKFLDVPMGQVSSYFMSQFISNVDPSKVMWFQASQAT